MQRLLVLLIACGGGTSPAPVTSGPPAPWNARGDIEVARVNGRPVYGWCVAAQAAHRLSREQALAQCIDFELLAQAAEARGLALDHDVAVETRTALVNQFVAREFEDKFTKPIEFGDYWPRIVEKNRWRFEHPEVRGSAYVRVQDPMLAKQIAAALASERGLLPTHLQQIAEKVVAGRAKIDFAVVAPDVRKGRLDETYVSALFAIPEVGRVSPPTHTKWGWDIILFASVIPAESPTPEQLAQKMLPDIKRSYFPHWVTKIAPGTKVQVMEQNVPLLENL